MKSDVCVRETGLNYDDAIMMKHIPGNVQGHKFNLRTLEEILVHLAAVFLGN